MGHRPTEKRGEKCRRSDERGCGNVLHVGKEGLGLLPCLIVYVYTAKAWSLLQGALSLNTAYSKLLLPTMNENIPGNKINAL